MQSLIQAGSSVTFPTFTAERVHMQKFTTGARLNIKDWEPEGFIH